MKTLIFGLLSAFLTLPAAAHEGALIFQERLDRQILESLKPSDADKVVAEDPELASRREEMQRVYALIQDEVNHIFPLFMGALDGQGAGARFTAEELAQICSEIKNKLSYHRSCEHAAKVAAGMSKEDVFNLHLRRKRQRAVYLARMNSLESEIQNTGVASR